MAGPARYLVVDQGGHASRAILFDGAGVRVAQTEVAVATRHPLPGRVEHDAREVLASVVAAIESVLAAAAIRPSTLRAAALSCQRASLLAWRRRDAQPLTPVLSWQDTRAADELAALELDAGQVQQLTGVRPNAHFGASKLAWLQRHDPALRAAARSGDLALGPLASFLLAALVEPMPYLASYSLAQRSLLFGLAEADWHPALCERFGIDRDGLPRCVADLGDFGRLRVAGGTVPLRLCAGDQNLLPLAVDGGAGDAVLNLGTGAFLLGCEVVAGARPTALLRSVLPGAQTHCDCVLEGTVNGAGSAFDWLARELGQAGPAWELLDRPPPRRRPLFRNRVGGSGSPFWQRAESSAFEYPPADATTAMHAVADSLGFLLRANIEAMAEAGRPVRRLLAGGGLARSTGLCERIAALSGCELVVCADHELSARGAFALIREPGTEVAGLRIAATHAQPLRDADEARFRDWRAFQCAGSA